MINITDFIQSHFHINILLILGFALFGGTLGGKLFQKLRIPQVIGYIIIGLLLGDMLTGFISADIVKALQPFSYFALGLIGFMIGGELKKSVLIKYGRQFITILLFEGMTTFIVVSILVTIAGFVLFRNWPLSISLGLLLGAISSATAPAATTDVLWEYRSKGPLTRTILGIVALDDGLALILFACASAAAGIISGTNDSNVIMLILKTLYEIGGSIILGGILGIVLTFIIKMQRDEDKMLMFSLGFVLLSIGIAIALRMDMLITAMMLGAITVNTAPRKSRDIFSLTENFTPPIYVLFFVLVGANLDFKHITFTILILAITYLLGRTGGKMIGAFMGAKLSKAPNGVRKYLSLCLFSQAGVAIGLSILAGQRFSPEIAHIIVLVITLTTFIVQLVGPYFVKHAVIKSGESGLNVTEEDILKSSIVRDIMTQNMTVVKETEDLNGVLYRFAHSDNLFFPVVNQEGKFIGIISIDRIKQVFSESEISGILLAHDIIDHCSVSAKPDDTVQELQNMMKMHMLEYIPVLDRDNKLEGFLEKRQIDKTISLKMAEINRKAETLG